MNWIRRSKTQVSAVHWPADIYICQDLACVLFFSLNDQNPVCLFWAPLSKRSFILVLSLSPSPPSLMFKWQTLDSAGLYQLPVATEALGNGIRQAISSDVNFIVANWEQRQCQPDELPVSPLTSVLISKPNISAGQSWPGSDWDWAGAQLP